MKIDKVVIETRRNHKGIETIIITRNGKREYIGIEKAFMGEYDAGYKQSLVDVKKIIGQEYEAGVCCDEALLEYIDTELKK